MKIAILGAGSVARAVALYLLNDKRVTSFTCFDQSKDNLLIIENYAGEKGKVRWLNATNFNRLVRKLCQFDGVINALPYALLAETTRACIIAGKSMVDLGGNTEVVNEQRGMHETALLSKATIVPACGLAPGVISDMAFEGMRMLTKTNNIEMFCGGLPQHPQGELMHGLFFNEEGLYNEYAEKPEIIKDGLKCEMPFLLPQTDVYFNTPRFKSKLESALTHGAFHPALDLWNKTKNVSYATLRYPGHFEKVREMIKNLDRAECVKQLKEKLGPAGDDLVALRVAATGKLNEKTAIFETEFVDFCDEKIGLTAMQRCTGFPAAEVLLQVLTGAWPNGVIYHEPFVNMDMMRQNLKNHGININFSLCFP